MWLGNNRAKVPTDSLSDYLTRLIGVVCSLFVLLSCTPIPSEWETSPNRVGGAGSEDGHFLSYAIEPGEVCVITENEVEAQKIEQFAQRRGYTRTKHRVLEGLQVVMSIYTVPLGGTVKYGLREFREAFPADIIDANHRYTLQSGNTALDPRRYGFEVVGWEEGGHQCVKEDLHIGMIDTAIDASHFLLSSKPINRESFVSENVPTPASEHGTAVATLLVGSADSHKPGLLPNARLSIAEAFRELEEGQVEATTWNIVRSLDWLVKQQVHVINLSLGGPPNRLLTYGIQQTLQQNIPLVAAAGNTGPYGDPIYPAAIEGVLAVTALDAKFQSYNLANRGDFIAFSAPGVDVWVPRGIDHGVYKSGTSYAAPFVTAAVAIVKDSHPGWSSDEVAEFLANRVVDLGEKGRDHTFGWGLIQLPNTCKTPSSS